MRPELEELAANLRSLEDSTAAEMKARALLAGRSLSTDEKQWLQAELARKVRGRPLGASAVDPAAPPHN